MLHYQSCKEQETGAEDQDFVFVSWCRDEGTERGILGKLRLRMIQ